MNEKITRNQRNRKKIGYSLIEALVALGILLLGIVPVVTVATQAILFHHRASETEEAARISQTMIDYIKSRGYDNLKIVGGEEYKLKATSDGAFTIDIDASSDFGRDIVVMEEDRIPNNLILLNSKGINLSQVNFYLVMNRTKGDLKKIKPGTDPKEFESYNNIDPITGTTSSSVYVEDLIYGKFIFGFGKTESSNLTKRKTEMVTNFIITPIENWK